MQVKSLPPKKIGRYEIQGEIDRGGMSTVYLAQDPLVGRDIALKLLPREFMHHQSFRARFLREARIVAALEHPAIVPIYDFGEDNGLPYFVMRYMTGRSLADRLAAGPMEISDIAAVLDRVGSALDHAHRLGVVHRDLKPANILFDENQIAYLGDFGIARLEETGATLTGTVYMGTPAYMSPEQVKAEGPIDGRADIYALGVILYEALTGHQPYKAETPTGVAFKHLTEPVPRILDSNPDLPPEVEQIIERAMAKDPKERYHSAGEMTADVLNLVGAQAIDGPGPAVALDRDAASSPPRGSKRGRRWLVYLLILLLLLTCCLVIAAGLYMGFRGDSGIFDFLQGATEEPTDMATEVPTATRTPTGTSTATLTPTLTETSLPTNTPTETPADLPTVTPSPSPEIPTLRPSNTPSPTATRAPATRTPSPTSPPIPQPTSPPPPTSIPPPTSPPPSTPIPPATSTLIPT